MSNFILVLILSLIPLNCFASEFIHPLDFKGSEVEKAQVISFIEASVKKTYSQIGMGDPSTLRMMENEELKSFKQLSKVGNRNLLDSVITQYCNIGMCNYNTIFMMYNEQNKASKAKLDW